MIISPNPRSDVSILRVTGFGTRDLGKSILMGPSKFLATETMTGVPKLKTNMRVFQSILFNK
jgi:hypothetical protein